MSGLGAKVAKNSTLGFSLQKWPKWAWQAHFRTGATTAKKPAENSANLSFRTK